MPAGHPPEDPPRSPRVDEVVAVARAILERDGAAGLTMRSVADELQIKAPSLYKHVAGKSAIEVELVRVALTEVGRVLHRALDEAAGAPGDGRPVRALLAAYRRYALDHPDMYRLATAGRLPREQLPPGLEDWAGEPFLTVTGDEHRAQALWSFAHGMVILELDDRFPAGSALDRTWAEGAAAFEVSHPPPAGQDRR
jgi:AcrR family transcriptional regulator